MLLLVRLLLALHLCGAVCASRNRIRHPGPASSGNPLFFQASLLFHFWLTQFSGSSGLALLELVHRQQHFFLDEPANVVPSG